MATIAPINKPLHAAQKTESLILIRLAENFSQSGWCPLNRTAEADDFLELGKTFGFWNIIAAFARIKHRNYTHDADYAVNSAY